MTLPLNSPSLANGPSGYAHLSHMWHTLPLFTYIHFVFTKLLSCLVIFELVMLGNFTFSPEAQTFGLCSVRRYH